MTTTNQTNRTAPAWYNLTIIAALIAFFFHVCGLGAGVFVSDQAHWLVKWAVGLSHGLGIVLGGAAATGQIAIFIFEHKTGWAIGATIAHILIISAVYFGEKWDWLPVWAAGIVFAITIPVMLIGVMEVMQTYRPGGEPWNDLQRWKQETCDVVNDNAHETNAALKEMQAQIRQLSDTVAALKDSYTTALRQATDTLTTQNDAHRTELEEAMGDAVLLRYQAVMRKKQRKAQAERDSGADATEEK